MSQYSLSWSSYKSNICNGLSSLQQNEEFVDMTLAADGYFVKVHQLIVSLASPYLKDLIKSAPCQHPVVFLNKISHQVLCSILEYIYTGEVVIKVDNLNNFLEAGKALRIKGLEDMSEQDIKAEGYSQESLNVRTTKNNSLLERLHKFKSRPSNFDSHIVTVDSTSDQEMDNNMPDPFTDCGDGFQDHDDDDDEKPPDSVARKKKKGNKDDIVNLALSRSVKSSTVHESVVPDKESKTVQYTLSNQGSLQLVLNRFVYFLRYAHKNSDPPVRQWRCVDYIRKRCPASLTTKDDIVVQRTSAHQHAFHDAKIMKKVRAGAIFTAIKDAETEGKQLMRNSKNSQEMKSDQE